MTDQFISPTENTEGQRAEKLKESGTGPHFTPRVFPAFGCRRCNCYRYTCSTPCGLWPDVNDRKCREHANSKLIDGN